MDRRVGWATILHGMAKSQTSERLTLSLFKCQKAAPPSEQIFSWTFTSAWKHNQRAPCPWAAGLQECFPSLPIAARSPHTCVLERVWKACQGGVSYQHFIHPDKPRDGCFFLELFITLLFVDYLEIIFPVLRLPLQGTCSPVPVSFLSNVVLPLQSARMNSSWNSQILVRKKNLQELVLNADFSGPV